MSSSADLCLTERQRILDEYERREREIPPDLYARWQPGEIFMLTGRRRMAPVLLHDAGVFPKPGERCLEIGFGSLGWLGDLITWGVREVDLHGVELDEGRTNKARDVLPLADLRVGDAKDLPWDANTFQLVIASTVFTSILDQKVRRLVAKEITRVLIPGGALLWYDFAVNNPRNAHVRKVTKKELNELFPDLQPRIATVTLAPLLARYFAPKSWTVATLLEAIPLLRTHLLAVLVKNR
jgi:ubiquinone/menaquinone biosynthesis C-methylase UbiE